MVISRVPGQPGLHSETLSQKRKERKKKSLVASQRNSLQRTLERRELVKLKAWAIGNSQNVKEKPENQVWEQSSAKAALGEGSGRFTQQAWVGQDEDDATPQKQRSLFTLFFYDLLQIPGPEGVSSARA
jgi:hypothetical protein